MSYEGKMLEDLKMPSRKEVGKALLKSLFKHNGVIKEFGAGEEIVDEIASDFGLSEEQRNAYLETIYRKENRVKKSSLWHRLLFRAADNLAKENLVCRPTETFHLTHKKEWMLTENGFDTALKILKIPQEQKDILPVKSFEVQKVISKLIEAPRPKIYYPIDEKKSTAIVRKEISIRKRGFRQAVIEAYDYKCAVCGMKIMSPNKMIWEVEAAHIVPHSSKGKDDILNGLSLCHLHHWAFDVGWFSLFDDYTITVSSAADNLQADYGRLESYEFIKALTNPNLKISLPDSEKIYPHVNSVRWHRENIFNKK
ncbi:MAG: HNH endonuclease [Segetibacter sp.]